MVDTTVRMSEEAYSSLVKARGLLESFHNGRLSLDEAAYISTQFTYEVLRLLMKEMMDERLAFTTNESARPETGQFLSLVGSDPYKYPAKLMTDLMDLTRLLLKKSKKASRERKK